jgi:hypothetical protein
MNSFDEIKTAAERLSFFEKQQLFYFLLSQLQPGKDVLPPPRDYSVEQIESWIAEDEAAMAKLRR